MKNHHFISFLLLMAVVLPFRGLQIPSNAAKVKTVEDGGTGPYKAVMKEEPTLAEHTVFAPKNLKPFGPQNRLPVLVWGNGACANSPWEHKNFLSEIASHGYIVLATGILPENDDPYRGPMSRSEQQIESIDWIISQNSDPKSPYYNKIDVDHICLSGMSCGGLQTLFNCADKRVASLMICNSGLFNQQNAGSAMPNMPMPKKDKLKEIHTPIIYILGGKEDIAYENGMDDFHRIKHVPAYAANLPVGHGGTYRQTHGGEFSIAALAWLDWQLKGDTAAARMFQGDKPRLTQREGWTVEQNDAARRMWVRNPIVQTIYSSDPAPMAYGDRMYVYTGHDEAGADFFWMYDWHIYSSADMVNWTDHGIPLSLASFTWADDRAWAAQCIERDGKFYWYICAHSNLSGGMAIGVAVSDTPTGPFRDAIGKPLFDNGQWDNIDPTVMIDDDGQAWLFWGNPNIHYARLNRDMVSFIGEVKEVKQTVEGFGSPFIRERQKDVNYKDCYTEGPWIMKSPTPAPSRGGEGSIYNNRGKSTVDVTTPLPSAGGAGGGAFYLLYAAGGIPEHIAYSSAPSPEGPWTYRGEIMPQEDTGSFTNHCGVATLRGHNYFFYHTGKLPGGGGFGRSVAVEEFSYNPDGSFPIIHHTDEGVKPIGTLNPYVRQEAETMAWSEGVHTEQTSPLTSHPSPLKSHPSPLTVYVSDINNGDCILVREVDFGADGPTSFTASAASALQGGRIEVRLDSPIAKPVATLTIPATGGWEQWQTVSTKMETVTGKHDVWFTFAGNKGAKLFNLDWWQFGK